MERIKKFFKELFRPRVRVYDGLCSKCNIFNGDDANYCMKCGSRFCSLFKHMKIQFKYHI